MKRTHFEIRPGKDGQIYVTLIAANGEQLDFRQGYNDIRDARKLIHKIKATNEHTPVMDYSTSNPESPGQDLRNPRRAPVT